MRIKFEDYQVGLPRWILCSGLPPAMTHALQVIFSHRNSKTGRCFPSMKTVSREAGLGVTTAKAARKRLRKVGLLEWKQGRGGRNYASYKFPHLNISNEEKETLKGNIAAFLLGQKLTSIARREPAEIRPGNWSKSNPVTGSKMDQERIKNLTEENTTTEKPAAVSPFFSIPHPLTPELKKLLWDYEENGINNGGTKELLRDHGPDRLREALEALANQEDIRNPGGWLRSFLTKGWKRPQAQDGDGHERRFKVTRDGVVPGAFPGCLYSWEDLIKDMGSEEKVRDAVEQAHIKEYTYGREE